VALVASFRGAVAARLLCVAWSASLALSDAQAQASTSSSSAVATVERIKPSIVAVGTLQALRQPQFRFSGTGFAVGDGTLIATNAHVLPRHAEPGSEA
jgi:serine protease Do